MQIGTPIRKLFAIVLFLLSSSCSKDDYRKPFCGIYKNYGSTTEYSVSLDTKVPGIVHINNNNNQSTDSLSHVDDYFVIDRYGCLLPAHDYGKSPETLLWEFQEYSIALPHLPYYRLGFKEGSIETMPYGDVILTIEYELGCIGEDTTINTLTIKHSAIKE